MELDKITTDIVFQITLVLLRIGPMLSFAPGLGELYVPQRARVVLAVFSSIVIHAALYTRLPHCPKHLHNVLTILFAECCVGVMLGITIRIYFRILDVVGSIIGISAGLGAASMFDPNQKTQTSVFAILLNMTGVIAVLVTDTHHLYFHGIIQSYDKFVVGNIIYSGDAAQLILTTISQSFILGFKIASPFIIVEIAIHVSSGVLSRLIPSLQVFFLILPVQIIAMLGVMMLVLPITVEKIAINLREMFTGLIL